MHQSPNSVNQSERSSTQQLHDTHTTEDEKSKDVTKSKESVKGSNVNGNENHLENTEDTSVLGAVGGTVTPAPSVSTLDESAGYDADSIETNVETVKPKKSKEKFKKPKTSESKEPLLTPTEDGRRQRRRWSRNRDNLPKWAQHNGTMPTRSLARFTNLIQSTTYDKLDLPLYFRFF